MEPHNPPPKFFQSDLRPIGTIAVAMSVVIATFIGASTWERVKVRPEVRTIEITGSAKRRIVSDLIEWTATIEATATDRVTAYKSLQEGTIKAQQFLEKRGVKADQVFPTAVDVDPLFDTVYEGTGEDRISKQVPRGFTARQSVVVRSSEVALVEKMSREITELLEQGVTITSSAPLYYYTKLGEVKIEMLAEASKDARTRAENMVNSAGGATIGELKSADMGVININPANSTQGSWDGNNDTSSLEKDIITIVHAKYALD